MMAKEKKGGESIPSTVKPAYDSVVSITGEFCSRFLNEEYAMLCRKLTGDLSRKRPSPLMTGNQKTWACGIVYALGQVNFLFDKTQTPHISAVQLCSLLGVSKSSGANTAKRISEMMKMARSCQEVCK